MTIINLCLNQTIKKRHNIVYITIQTACFEQWDLVLLLVNNVTPYAAAQTPSLLPKGMKDAQDPHLRILLQP